MNETPPGAEEGVFEPRKMRSIADVKRSSDDSMVAGVCGGLAKHLNIDPVILRVILVALTFVGFAGLILYLAGWFLLPADNEDKSIAAQWFKLDDNEEQFRTIGLIVAGVLAITAGAGFFGNSWAGPFPWLAILTLAAVYFWIIKPTQRRKELTMPTDTVVDSTAVESEPPGGETVGQGLDIGKEPKAPWSPVLTLVTLFSALIAVGGVALYADANGSLPWSTYAVAVLGVIGVGLLIGTFFGNAGPLIPIGGMVAIALAISAILPSARFGHDVYPEDTSTVSSSYKLGIGELELNLDEVSNQTALTGRTIKVEVGIGTTRIVVPRNLNVEVNAKLNAGEIQVFDRKSDGTQNEIHYSAEDRLATKLTLDVRQTIGAIEVIRQ
ncbi:MAG: PspC domain-containing protein [Aeromicrobium sp.]